MAADSVQPGGLKERRGREELIEIFFHQLWAHDSLCETQHILDFTAPPFRPAFSGPLWKPYRCMAFLTQMYGNLLQRNRAPSFCRLWNFGSNFVTFSVIRVWLRCVCMCVFVCLCVCFYLLQDLEFGLWLQSFSLWLYHYMFHRDILVITGLTSKQRNIIFALPFGHSVII